MNPAQRQKAEGILFTDAYQLSMAHLYFRVGLHERLAQFAHLFREYPSDETPIRYRPNHADPRLPTSPGDAALGSVHRLAAVFKRNLLSDPLSIDVLRQRRQADLDRLQSGVNRLMPPHIDHVALMGSL